MIATIEKSVAIGSVYAPPSKSMAHRLLICAGLADGKSIIKNVAFSQDILATLDCLSAIGAEYKIYDDTVEIKGANPKNIKNNVSACCRESGSTLRFFIPIMLLCGKSCSLNGSAYLLKRPLSVYENICLNQGITFNLTDNCLNLKGPLNSGEFIIDGGISSQFISGLLFALPLMAGDSIIKITPPVESRSYINMTISALKTFGVFTEWLDENTILVKGNQSYTPGCVNVEGDYSNAAFYEAFNRIGGNIEIAGLNKDSLQGDKVFYEYYDLLSSGTLKIDITDCPDLAPILITLASIFGGAEFTGTKRLEIKESNRGKVMAEELAKFGADIDVFENNIIVNKTELHPPLSVLSSHNDHRIVMSLSVISSIYGGIIQNCEAVSKSFPDFFDKIKSLGIKVVLNEN